MPRTTLSTHEATALGRRSGQVRRERADRRRLDHAVALISERAGSARPPLTDQQRQALAEAAEAGRQAARAMRPLTEREAADLADLISESGGRTK